MLTLLSFFWLFRTSKIILFYLYLWQLKEYHIGRFLDHFHTEKGKRLIFNKPNFIKVVLSIGFLYFLLAGNKVAAENPLKFLAGAVLLLYVFESLLAAKSFLQGKLKRPVFTKKALFLLLAASLLEIIILFALIAFAENNVFRFSFWLLIFDFLAPLTISITVVAWQPLTVFWRNKAIKKAKIKRAKLGKLTAVGITGSYGKTSVKEFLYQILSQKFNVQRTKEHQNSEIGISQSILENLKPDHQIFIAEMGSYARGGIKLLCDIVQPKIGIITGVNEQHLALFGSMGNLLLAEGGRELVDSLPKDGLIIFNGDNKYCLELYKTTNLKKKICSVSKAPSPEVFSPDIWAENVKVNKESISFLGAAKEGERADFKVNLLAGYNVLNILLAAAAAKEMGMTLPEIAKACLKISPEQGAMKKIKGKEGLTIIDASYSANPDGVMAGLDYLKIYSGKKIIVMPCLIELGKASKEIHKKIGKKIGEVCAPAKEPYGSRGAPSGLAIITTKERFEDIKEGAKESGMKEENIVFIENPEEILARLNIFYNPDDVVLLEGRVPKELVEGLEE